ncbi:MULTISPECIES: hypothetical protein [Methylomonas]|nr:hypothetical protein [Methylomonas rhizoryzae]
MESASSGAEVQTFGYDDMDRVTDALGNWAGKPLLTTPSATA